MSPAQTQQAHTILIVEDDLTIRETLGEILEDEGYQVAYAEHGRAALEHLQVPPPPTLILLDLMMPVMNGWEFRTLQLEDSRLSRIPVFVISGVSNDEARLEDLQPAEIFGKPIEVPRLLEAVSNYC